MKMRNYKFRDRHERSAFTLIELLLVMVILVVLAAVVVPKFTGRSEQARLTAAKTDISAIGGAIAQFEGHHGPYPTNEEGLGALIQAPAGLPNWQGPYLKRNAIPNDPWGNAYQYRFPGTHNASTFDLFSTGADGREGNDDVTNW